MSTIAIAKAPATGQINAAVTTVQIFPTITSATVASALPCPGTLRCEQKVFIVRASGFVTTAATLNVQVTLYSGTSLTPGSNTVLFASTARAANTVSCPWMIQAELIFDSISGKLHGLGEALVNNLYDTRAALSNVVTGVNGTTEPPLNFVVGVSFSVANVGNIGGCAEFVLEQ